jgi:hypothetical protein
MRVENSGKDPVEFGGQRGDLLGPRRIVRRLGGSDRPLFSICTMVTTRDEYKGCHASLMAGGFNESNCEYLIVDNSVGNVADAYVCLNEFLQASSGIYLIVCHQDILLLDQGADRLRERLSELDNLDPNWAVCGNAGCTHDGQPVIRISDPWGEDQARGGPFPRRVMSLDENFLVIRKLANLGLSHDLVGFHHYGTDICLMADITGWSIYVIDFHLRHKSSGNAGTKYRLSQASIAAKYRRALRPRWIHNVVRQPFFISGLPGHTQLAQLARKLFKTISLFHRSRLIL